MSSNTNESSECGSRCELCGRLVRNGTTKHHLIPRRCHRNKWFQKRFTREQMGRTIPVCRDCHRAIHRLIPSEKELGRYFHTIESLRGNEKIAKYLTWARKQR